MERARPFVVVDVYAPISFSFPGVERLGHRLAGRSSASFEQIQFSSPTRIRSSEETKAKLRRFPIPALPRYVWRRSPAAWWSVKLDTQLDAKTKKRNFGIHYGLPITGARVAFPRGFEPGYRRDRAIPVSEISVSDF